MLIMILCVTLLPLNPVGVSAEELMFPACWVVSQTDFEVVYWEPAGRYPMQEPVNTICGFKPTIQMVPCPPKEFHPWKLYGFGNPVSACWWRHPFHSMSYRYKTPPKSGEVTPCSFFTQEPSTTSEFCDHISGKAPVRDTVINAMYQVWCDACHDFSGTFTVLREFTVGW